MHELIPLSCGDKNIISKIFAAETSRSADYCFGNYYIWDGRFRQYIAVVGNRLVTSLTRQGECWFAFPVGSGDIAPAMEYMKELCRQKDTDLKICGICAEHLPLLGEEFEVCPDRSFSDYIYRLDALAEYSGKSLHGKKNFCNRFEREHDWRFEELTQEKLPLCRELLSRWLSEEGDRLEESISFESDALSIALDSFSELNLEGGILFAEDEPIGFSIGEMLTVDTFCVHFEKAFSRVVGAYAMLCRETAKMVRNRHPDIYYINREDDMGMEKLRTSKLSYKPEYILEKYTAIWKRKK